MRVVVSPHVHANLELTEGHEDEGLQAGSLKVLVLDLSLPLAGGSTAATLSMTTARSNSNNNGRQKVTITMARIMRLYLLSLCVKIQQ